MIKNTHLNLLPIILSILSLITEGHMLMKTPLPRGYKGNPSYTPVDYDLNGPLTRLVRIDL
jgi:hypothetical protein